MLKGLIRRLRRPPQLNAYEREVLVKEYQRLWRQLQALDDQLGTVHCASCVQVEEVGANRVIARKRALQRTLDDIAWKLGSTPEVENKSKRARRASS